MVSDAQRKQRQQAAKTHGIFSFEERGPDALEPSEVASLQELRDMIDTPEGEREVVTEVKARLVIIVRKVFNDMAQLEKDPKWWDAGVVGRGGTYLAELRRWLIAFPSERGEAKNITEALEMLGNDD